jgi:hypothetical protein
MNNGHSRDWLLILGQFGVIALLLFVGMQIKQDHEIALLCACQFAGLTIRVCTATPTGPYLSNKVACDRPTPLGCQ